jgi:hypothetical protein
MNEAEWLAGTDLDAMLRHLHGRVSVRNMRLFACACCRRLMHLCLDARLPGVIGTAERYAEGRATEGELEAANLLALAIEASPEPADTVRWIGEAVELATSPIHDTMYLTESLYAARQVLPAFARQGEMAAQCALLREIVGNPFRALQRAGDWLRWNRGTVREMARTIADERRFDELPILADALVEAGCDSEAILRHCREEGPHVLGCWVLDGLLARG